MAMTVKFDCPNCGHDFGLTEAEFKSAYAIRCDACALIVHLAPDPHKPAAARHPAPSARRTTDKPLETSRR